MEGNRNFEIPIEEDDILTIERLWYEYKGYENIMVTMHRSSNPNYDYSKCEIYDKMVNKYNSIFAEYNIAYGLIIDKYIDKDLRFKLDKVGAKISISFIKSCIVVDFDQNSCTSCCEV